ncbi:hypothetical protein [uncultured Mediterranean phage uvMED]|nr:hypothetical protein [uncultured Mediterranean phage uvMED]BAR22561.1 hypothetical protein [uncultured Mediterranean phage uvMED]
MAIKDRLITGLIAVLFFMLLIIFRGCGKDSAPQPLEIVKTEEVKIYIKGKSDTITIIRDSVVYKQLPADTVIVTVDKSGDSIFMSRRVIKDSLIDAVVDVKAAAPVKSIDFRYTPLFPKYIYRVDTVKVKHTDTVKKQPKRVFYAGGIAKAGINGAGLAPSVLYKTKKENIFSGGYDLVNRTYEIGAFIPLSH